MSVRCGKGHGYHRDAQAVRACYKGATVWLESRDGEPVADDGTGYDPVAAARDSHNRNRRLEADRAPAGTDSHAQAVLSEGWYCDIDGKLEVFKVVRAVHGSGNLYAKVLNTSDGKWDYAKGAIRRIQPEWKMTLRDALKVAKATSLDPNSALYGRCWVCGQTLTREESIERRMGAVCAGKFS